MKLKPNGFSTEDSDLPFISPGKESDCEKKAGSYPLISN